MAIHQQRLITYFFSLALLALGTTAVLGQTATIPAEAQQATSTVRPKAIEAHMRYLADDKLEGRGPGTHGYELAAQYVEGELKKMGYKPAGEKGTYRQNVPLRSGQVDAKASSVVFIRDGKELHLNYGKNYILNPNFDQPRSEVSAPIVFVGYGISAPELGYDDYAQIDVNGKIVAYFNGAPTVFPSNQRAYYGSAKAEIAAAHGAVGVISFSLPTDVRARVEAAAPRARQATYRWIDRQGKAQRTFPQIQATVLLSDSTARSLFAGTAKSFDEAVAVAHRSYPQAFPLNASIRVKTQTSLNDDLVGQNVIGLLPGSDPVLKNEYVVYVSHLDHLGIGPPVKGDSIYNGAHDNASGVAINLETARLFASLPKAPRRSILFVGVTGEEMGLLGSDYFASNPTVPAEKLVANLCLDMPFFFPPAARHCALWGRAFEHGAGGSVSGRFSGRKRRTRSDACPGRFHAE